MKAFLDTNVLLSAYYFNGNERRVLRKAIDGEFTAVTSPLVIKEVANIMSHKFREDTVGIGRFLEALLKVLVLKMDAPCDVPDLSGSDCILLSTARGAGCDFFVTGDKKILNLGCIGRMRIVNSREFLKECL